MHRVFLPLTFAYRQVSVLAGPVEHSKALPVSDETSKDDTSRAGLSSKLDAQILTATLIVITTKLLAQT